MATRSDPEFAGGTATRVHHLVPILNVSDLAASFDWFAKLGWSKKWDWADGPGGPPTFGAVGSGEHIEIFLCLNGQGGRGRDGGVGGDGQGVWLSLFVDDVDAVHAVCINAGLEVLRPPEDEPWGVREMLVRHPDGHTLRVGSDSHHHEHPHTHEH